VLYSGYVVLALSLVSVISWRARSRAAIRDRVPAGYGLGLLGAALFAVGGLADMIWHSVLGVEVDLQALLSPPHLLLVIAGMLMIGTPLRAAGLRGDRPTGPLGRLPAILSVFAATATAAFFLEYLSPFLDVPVASGDWRAQSSWVGEYLVTTALMVVPVLYAWVWLGQIPPGMITAVALAVAVPVGVFNDFEFLAGQLWSLAGAVTADAAVQAVAARRPRLVPFVAGLAIPALVWPLHLLGVARTVRIAWALELCAGVIVLCSLLGALLGGLLLPRRPHRDR
jgi:hypothetical protein